MLFVCGLISAIHVGRGQWSPGNALIQRSAMWQPNKRQMSLQLEGNWTWNTFSISNTCCKGQ